MLELLVHLQTLVVCSAHRRSPSVAPRLRGSQGQTTAEYALVMLGAAAIAGLILTWASKSNVVGKLFDFAMSKVIGFVK